ncbi:MAG TPA: 30S ribosomal protein S20 [Patescibacteria group bacterium]
MPVLKHAKKKLKQDKKRTAHNKALKELFKKLVKEARASKSAEAVNKAFSSIDKAAKHHILPENRAARMKSALTKFVEGKAPAAGPAKKVVAKKTKKTVAKKVTKKKTAK